jgi:hypothetical protein
VDCCCWTLMDYQETKSEALKSDSFTNEKTIVFWGCSVNLSRFSA